MERTWVAPTCDPASAPYTNKPTCKGPNNFIKEQLNIVREALNEVAEHYLYLNHTIKNLRNNFYDVCSQLLDKTGAVTSTNKYCSIF